jgi:ComF family protein
MRSSRSDATEYSQGLCACQPTQKSVVDRCFDALSRLIWPPTCVLCGGAGVDRDLCNGCRDDLRRNAPACTVCANPLPSPLATLCGICVRKRPRFDAAYVPFAYEYPLDHLVQGLKYRGHGAAGRVLGDLLGEAIISTWATRATPLPELLVPVPLGAQRYRDRGYNQATEIAIRVAKLTGVELCTDLIARVRETPEQAGLRSKERRRNLRGAFELSRALPVRSIAILDDVMTTGSTMNELARVLKRAGARRVEVWAVARVSRRAT